jgi:ATP-dependent RNA helicase HelY
VLGETELAPGDFVRWTKQVIDLLDQIGSTGDGDLRGTAVAAIAALRRGVVNYSAVA